MSYAVVRVGGKQYRVEEGQSIVVDRLPASEGDKVDLGRSCSQTVTSPFSAATTCPR